MMKHFYNETISLNNIGVSLMERYSYEEALETFDNALRVFFASQPQPFKAQWMALLRNISQSSPFPSEIEYLVYRAKLYVSCDNVCEYLPPLIPFDEYVDEDDDEYDDDDDDDDDYDDDDDSFSQTSLEEKEDEKTFIIYDQYGQDMSLNRPSGLVCTSPFQQLDGNNENSRNYLVYFRQPREGKFTKDVISTLLASILFNNGQACRCLALMQCHDQPHASECLLDEAGRMFYLSHQAAEGEDSSNPMSQLTSRYLEEIRSTSFLMSNEAKRQSNVGTMSFSPKQLSEALSRIVLMMVDAPPPEVQPILRQKCSPAA